jgi:6-phosphogluconate dehydrogenase (decarboxylating)
MISIGFIGLGITGRPMAANLVQAGSDVRGYPCSEATRARAEEAGVRLASTPDVLWVCKDPRRLPEVRTARDSVRGLVDHRARCLPGPAGAWQRFSPSLA